jgi:uncharacterized membrane protein YvbJ
MPSICPNCNRSVRKGARFCGYCGADLDASIRQAQNNKPSPINEAAEKSDSPNGKPTKRKRSRACCVIWFFLVFILCLAIIVTLILYYWQYIIPLLGQILF